MRLRNIPAYYAMNENGKIGKFYTKEAKDEYIAGHPDRRGITDNERRREMRRRDRDRKIIDEVSL